MDDNIIKIKLPAWTMAEDIGYTPKTTFWQDFSIADAYGPNAVKDTYKRAFEEWKTDVTYLTELVLVLNHKAWQHDGTRDDLAALYSDLYYEADSYALDNLKGSEKEYYLNVTD